MDKEDHITLDLELSTEELLEQCEQLIHRLAGTYKRRKKIPDERWSQLEEDVLSQARLDFLLNLENIRESDDPDRAAVRAISRGIARELRKTERRMEGMEDVMEPEAPDEGWKNDLDLDLSFSEIFDSIEYQIARMRTVEMTFQAIGDELGLSKYQVRRIQKKMKAKYFGNEEIPEKSEKTSPSSAA